MIPKTNREQHIRVRVSKYLLRNKELHLTVPPPLSPVRLAIENSGTPSAAASVVGGAVKKTTHFFYHPFRNAYYQGAHKGMLHVCVLGLGSLAKNNQVSTLTLSQSHLE